MRAVLVAAVLVAAVLSGTGGGADVAAAQEPPTITVTPSSGIHDGDEVEVRITGWGDEQLLAIYQCDAAVLDDLSDRMPCVVLRYEVFGVGDPYVHSVRVSELFAYTDSAGDEQVVQCGDEPGDCAIVAWTPDSDRTLGVAIDVAPSPLAVLEAFQETGFPVTASVAVPPGTTARLAECGMPVPPSLPDGRCTPPQPVSLDAGGRALVPFTVVDRFTTPAGPVDCAEAGCAVSLFDGDGALLRAVAVSVLASDGPPVLASESTTRLRDGVTISVEVTGIRNEGFVLAQCDASVASAGQLRDGPCGPTLFTHEASPSTIGTQPEVLVHATIAAVDGSTVQCEREPGACVLALASDLGNFTSIPLSFEVPDTLTLSPASGLLEGQAITVEAADLDPETPYRLFRCAGVGSPSSTFDGRMCDTRYDDAPTVVSSPQGRLTTVVPARQRFTTLEPRNVYCRDQCQIVLVRDRAPRLDHVVAEYAMAAGSVAAAPSTGLSDGQAVTFRGTDIMPSYDGPTYLFLHAGAWAIGECGPGVVDDPTIGGILRNCTVPPGGGPVEVAGSTFEATVRAQDRVDPPFGDPVDCAGGADACVLALARWEQDGTVSIHTAPIAFAP